MKLISITVLFFFLGLSAAFPQEKLLSEISDIVCECMEEQQKKDKKAPPKELSEKCMSQVVTKNEKKIRKQFNMSAFDSEEEAGERLGLEIVKVLMQECEVFMELVLASSKNKASNATEVYDKAEAEKNQGNYQEAISLYNAAIAIEPKAEYINSRGTAYFFLGKFYYALSDFIRAIELAPENYIHSYNLAYTLYELEDVKEALVHVNAAIEKNNTYCDSYNLKGLIFGLMEEYDSCVVFYTKAFNCEPTDGVKAYNIGRAYYDNENYPQTIEWLSRSDSLGYHDKDVYNYLGNALFELKEFEKSASYYLTFAEFDSLNYVPYYNLGTSYFELEEYQKAIAYFEKAYSIEESDVDIVDYLSSAYVKLKDYDKALGYINKALEINPAKPEFYDYRAEIYESKEMYLEAIDDYKVSLSLYPRDCDIYERLIGLYHKVGNTDKATGFSQKADALGCDEEK